METLKKIVTEKGTPLLFFSSKEFKESYQNLQKFLPTVKHHYALKPLPLKECVEIIDDCEGYIDIASVGEIEFIKNTRPELLSKAIYTHPIKKLSDISIAIENGVNVMVVDNIIELKKLIPFASEVKILFRLSFSNSEALCDLSEKFGINESTFKELLTVALNNKMNVLGCCFHVGSQMKHPQKHVDAIVKCRELYDWAFVNLKIKFPVLNIGGGFPTMYSENDIDLESYCMPIDSIIKELFFDTEIWSEPGRTVAANSMLAFLQVVGKAEKNGTIWYYLDDGAFNTFSGIFFEHMNYNLFQLNPRDTKDLKSIFTGPTCDGYDILLRDVMFPELEVGDVLFAKRIGAYSWATRTNFNLLGETPIEHYDFNLLEIENFTKNQIKEKYAESI